MMFNEDTTIVAVDSLVNNIQELQECTDKRLALIDVYRVRDVAKKIRLDMEILVEQMGGKWPYN